MFPRPLWLIHYNNLFNKPNKLENWAICVACDSEVRRRACTSSIDPSIFHLAIWNDLEVKHIGRVALETVRAEMAKTAGSSHGPKLQGTSGSRCHPYGGMAATGSKSSFRGNPNRLQIAGPDTPAQFRCFVCGDLDSSHHSCKCNARKLVNGKDAIIFSRKEGEPRTDFNRVSYCYSFNGRSGCEQSADCSHGKHWCTLCGAKGGSHAAQGCGAL
ncbi:hypothetical protein B0H13DRAFT_2315142 [Mycena leptocephala]|nr:hypothetical protein B0H13DRAFT_2315142 [Mycena leptocephala]